MKHITAELEKKIWDQEQFCLEQAQAGLKSRLEGSTDGIPTRPVEANEAEAAGWVRALRWVLHEGGCY
jgi:hypothetical protein